MRVTHAALVWVFGVAATFLGVGPLGGGTSALDNEQVHAAPTVSASTPTNPVRETKAPTPTIGPDLATTDVLARDVTPHLVPVPTSADPRVRLARAPPTTTRV